MKTIIDKRRILSEYNKHAKIKINMRGAEILQEQAKKHAMETGNDACIEISPFETKNGKPFIIS